MRVIVEADGGSRGNPGPAGYGAVVFDAASGEVLVERAEGIGVATNNVAEYQGLIAGLRAAEQLGAGSVAVRMDSKLVVEQMCGRWKIKHPALRPLALEAQKLARGFDRITYEWIPRAKNSHADRLANEAMDAQAGNAAGRAGRGKAERAQPPAPAERTPRPEPAQRSASAEHSRPATERARGMAAADAAAEQEFGAGVERGFGAAEVAASDMVAERAAGAAAERASGAAEVVASGMVAGRADGAGAERGRTTARAEASSTSAERTEAALSEASPAKWTGAVGTPTRFLLLRHGQTDLSVERRYSGRGEVALTALGERQAKSAGLRIAAIGGIDADTPIVSSPLGRARQTAAAVAEATGGTVEVHDGLTETDFGAWERLTFAEAAARDAELHTRWLADHTIPAPDGESFDQVHRRVRRVRDELIARYGARTIVVVSHVTPIKSLLRMGLDAGPSLLYRLHLDLASLSVVEFYPDGHASVRLVNDTSHLSGS